MIRPELAKLRATSTLHLFGRLIRWKPKQMSECVPAADVGATQPGVSGSTRVPLLAELVYGGPLVLVERLPFFGLELRHRTPIWVPPGEHISLSSDRGLPNC